MKRALQITAGLALAALLVWAALRLFPGPRERVRRQLQALAADVSFTPDDPQWRRLAYPQRITGYFTDNVDVQVALGQRESRQVLGRSELFESVAGLRAALRGLKVEFFDIVVELGDDRAQATAYLTATIRPLGDADYYVQEFRIALERQDKTWRVRRVETVKTLE